MHEKFCVIDNQIVISGSYNWTDNAELRNAEHILQTPAASCRTLCDAEFARRADGSPALTRTSFFTEAPLVWCGARYLLLSLIHI